MPTHPALRPMAPLEPLAVAEVVLKVLVKAVNVVEEEVDARPVVPEDV